MISYRSEVDGIRAIAIASVVLFHGWSSAFPGGYVGVDIFFVISGFLITSIIFKEMTEGSFTYFNFYERRARRILPALLAMIAVTTAAAFLLFLPDELIEYGKVSIYTLLFGANFRLAAEQGYFHHATQENPLLHMWSLAVEEQFYLLWPTLLVLMLRFLPGKRQRQTVFGLFLLSLAVSETLVQIWPKSAFFHLPSRGWELLAGAILAMRLIPRLTSRTLAEALSAAGLVLMIAPVFLYDKDTPFPGVAALAPVLGCALVIYATEAQRTRVAAILSLRPVVFIGLISYSLYLWHWPIFAFASYELLRPLTSLDAFLCLILALAAATISWRFIERPFRRRSKPARSVPVVGWSFRLPIGRAAQFAVVITAALIASGSFFQESKGAGWRFPPEVRNVLDRVHRGYPCVVKNEGFADLKTCEFGDRPADLVLWGDSHADHYLPLIASVYQNGTEYMTAGCVPVAGAQLLTNSGKPFREACAKNNRHVLERILEIKPKIVVMASRWTQTEDLPYGLENRPVLFLTAEGGALSREASRQTFAQALNQTVSTLLEAGIKVVLMGQVPEMPLPPARCFAPFTEPNWNDCGFVTRKEVERRQGFINATLDTIEKKHQGVFVYRPFPEFCDDAYCYAIKDHNLRYFDNDHLNTEGALTLAGAFQRALPREFRLPAGMVVAGAE